MIVARYAYRRLLTIIPHLACRLARWSDGFADDPFARWLDDIVEPVLLAEFPGLKIRGDAAYGRDLTLVDGQSGRSWVLRQTRRPGQGASVYLPANISTVLRLVRSIKQGTPLRRSQRGREQGGAHSTLAAAAGKQKRHQRPDRYRPPELGGSHVANGKGDNKQRLDAE